MKIKLLLATIIGAVTINGAVAGTCNYCPPPAKCAKCPVDCCDAQPGNINISYMSDYYFRGVRYSRDAVGLGASYSFDQICLPITLGFNHISSLSSAAAPSRLGNATNSGDQTNVFAAVGLPSICGFDLGLRYDHYLYPNLRTPSDSAGPRFGDSHGQLGLTIARELFCGVQLAVTSAYDFQSPSAQNHLAIDALGAGISPVNRDQGAWIHTAELSKSLCITDCVGLDLRGGVLYTDNVWAGGSGSQRSAGWNSYYLEAAMPISVGCCATLSPYIGYNGTPDTWLADDISAGIPGGNRNDGLNGGVRLNVAF